MRETDTGSSVVAPRDACSGETEEPPDSSVRHARWKEVSKDQWEDWRWQMQNAVRTTSQLMELLPFSPEDVATLETLEAQYKLAIPPYYFSLINVGDPVDPIRLQAVPSPSEYTDSSTSTVELEDPLEEDKDSPVPGLTHRYPDRVLLVTTHVCSMYCRFCTRKRVTMDRDGWDGPSHNDQRMIDYVRQHPEIHDCIVSGGDPLTLPLSKLRWFVNELTAIDHVDVIRIGTRVPVTLPQRLYDPQLIEVLRQAGKIWIQTHFNHPAEITPESARACRLLVNAGMPVSNHAVLLKGVNDSVETMRRLVRGLLKIKVRPYYLFHCDPVTGAGHFRTSIWKGLEIIEGLRGHVSGLGVPTYVVDGLHGAGKVPLMPNYLVSASNDSVVLRNYEGLLFKYAPEDHTTTAAPIQSLGVSNLLSGNGQMLMPEGNVRMQRRKAIEAAAAAEPAATAPTILPLDVIPITFNGTANGAVNGNGHAGANGAPTNGASKRPANGAAKPKATNGHANGHTSGSANGAPLPGATNGKANGKSNGAAKPIAANGANGKVNGKTNGTSKAKTNGTAKVIVHVATNGKPNGVHNGKQAVAAVRPKNRLPKL
ncbi:MAG: KamA family radical SAM protein [Planctomycetes bacterium]|nr:KamA family radical SAM protein [Planctomycetota bacterium]